MEVFFVLPLLIGVALAVGVFVSEGRKHRSALESVARKFNGTVDTSWLSGAAFELTVDGVPARLTCSSGAIRDIPYTRLRFKTPVGGRLRVVPDRLWESLKKAFGAEDLRVGDPAFDKVYVVQGFPARWMRRVLDASARARVDRLAALGSRYQTAPTFTLEAGPAGVLIAVSANLINVPSHLDTFVAEAIEVFRALRKEVSATILSAQEIIAKGGCPICEHPFDAAPRRCGTCDTPHHAECWAYFGGCSNYVCEENP